MIGIHNTTYMAVRHDHEKVVQLLMEDPKPAKSSCKSKSTLEV